MQNSLKKLLRPGLVACLLMSMTLAALAEGYKINDRVMAPWGGSLAAGTIVAGPNYRGELRIHFDKTDASRDKWIAAADLRPFAALGELKPGDLIQVEIMSAWQWVEVVEVKDDQVLCHTPNATHESDTWYPKDKLRQAPETEVKPEAWSYPFLNGDFVKVNTGGPTPQIGRFTVRGGNMYVGDYRVTDVSKILGKWEPRYKVGEIVRNHRGTRQWAQAKIDKVQPGSYDLTLTKTGQQDSINEDAIAPDWDYDGFYALAAPLFGSQNPLNIDWLIGSDKGTMNGFTVNDAQLKAGMDLLARSESQLKAKYPNVAGSKDCPDCPAQLMDLLARRKQVVMKACGMDVKDFVERMVKSYQDSLEKARKHYFWELPGSLGAVNVAAAVKEELAGNEADLLKSVARNKIIDPGYVFNYDRTPIVQAATKAQAEFAGLLQPYAQVSTDISQYSSHDGSAEALATAYVRKIDPQARIVGAATLAGGWKLDTSVSVNTRGDMATITRQYSTSVLVRTTSPKYKFPVVYSMSMNRGLSAAAVDPHSVLMAFYKG